MTRSRERGRAAYLNHAGTSWPKPAPVRDAAVAALAAEPAAWPELFAAAHERVAQAFGIADPARLLLTPGGTSALAVAVADHAWRAGDRILTSGLEHHALGRPLAKLAEQAGVEVVPVPPGGGSALDLDRLERELRRGRVRMVAVTAACNVTGELLPVAELAPLARERGALCLVDASQTAGWLPIDVRAPEVDLLAFAGHKALCAPWGIGGLWVAPQVEMRTPAASCELPPPGAPSACSPRPGYCDVGSVDRIALAGLEAALDWLAAPARAGRLEHARARAARLAETARELGLTVHGASEPSRRLPTVALTSRPATPAELARALEARGVFASAGLQCAPSAHATLGTAPAGVLRLSLGVQSTDEDVERACAALRAIA